MSDTKDISYIIAHCKELNKEYGEIKKKSVPLTSILTKYSMAFTGNLQIKTGSPCQRTKNIISF